MSVAYWLASHKQKSANLQIASLGLDAFKAKSETKRSQILAELGKHLESLIINGFENLMEISKVKMN